MTEARNLIRVVDYETTGTPEDQNAEIIEIGFCDLILPGKTIGGSWSSLVRPTGPIPPQAKAVHHITEADVAEAPALREVLDQLTDGAGDVFAAHNAQFEAHFTPYDLRWICTYKCARVVWPDAPGHSNQCLRYWLGIDEDDQFSTSAAVPPHRAMPDAYVTAFILARLLRERTIEELLTISTYPALLKIMNFGKHKGTAFADAPTDYLEWIRDKSDLDADTKFSAKYWLQKRNAA